MSELEIQGKTLEILRKKANKTQSDGARIFGHGRSWLNDIEKGRLNITLENGRRLGRFHYLYLETKKEELNRSFSF